MTICGVGVNQSDTLFPPYIASSDVQRSLEISKRVAAWNEEALYGIEVHTNDISHLGIACFSMVHEHHKSALVLTEAGLINSSMALMRPMFEAYVRGLWLVYATQEEFNQYQAGRDSLDLERAIKLIVNRSGKSRFNDALEMWKVSKKTLHGYVHNSFQAMIRRSGLIEMPTEDVVSMLNFSSGLAIHASIEITEIMDSDALPEQRAAIRLVVNSLQLNLVKMLAEMGLVDRMKS